MKKIFLDFVSSKSIRKQISYISKTTGIPVEVIHKMLQLPNLKSKLKVIENIYEELHIEVFGCAPAEFSKKHHTSRNSLYGGGDKAFLGAKQERSIYYTDIVLAKKYLSLLKKYNKTLILILKFLSQDDLNSVHGAIKEYIKEFKNETI